MKTLVYVEHDGGQVKDATLAAVTAASKLGEVHALVAGSNIGAVAEAASKIAGIGKVHVADAAHLDHGLAENVAPVAAKLMETHDAFVVPSTTTGRNLAPRVAALLATPTLQLARHMARVFARNDGHLEERPAESHEN